MKKNLFGFTLIELLVVISIIGILTTLVAANLNAARERGRDAQRKSDLASIRTALRLYYNDNGRYPASEDDNIQGCGADGTDSCTWGEEWKVNDTKYMPKLPDDPLSDQYYKYLQLDEDSYTLSACLENKSDDKGVVAGDTTWCPTNVMYTITEE